MGLGSKLISWKAGWWVSCKRKTPTKVRWRRIHGLRVCESPPESGVWCTRWKKLNNWSACPSCELVCSPNVALRSPTRTVLQYPGPTLRSPTEADISRSVARFRCPAGSDCLRAQPSSARHVALGKPARDRWTWYVDLRVGGGATDFGPSYWGMDATIGRTWWANCSIK